MALAQAGPRGDDCDLPTLLGHVSEQLRPLLGPTGLNSLLCVSKAVRLVTGHRLVEGLRVDFFEGGAPFLLANERAASGSPLHGPLLMPSASCANLRAIQLRSVQ